MGSLASLLVPLVHQPHPADGSLALFDLFGSAEKTLHANPGKHGDLPVFELDSALRFFTRHLASACRHSADGITVAGR